MIKLKEISKDIYDVDEWMDNEYGKEGTPEREQFRREAYVFTMGQMICKARKEEKMTQSDLAQRVGTNKSYISKVENGQVEPGIGIFLNILDVLGLKFEITKPVLTL